MYILDINRQRRSMAKTGFMYLFISFFCILFGAAYEYFSHEVYSYFMLYAFIFPLAGGTLPFLGLAFCNLPLPGRISCNLYHSGIAALTIGSLFEGILKIYGTTNRLVVIYWVMGAVEFLGGLILYGIGSKKMNL